MNIIAETLGILIITPIFLIMFKTTRNYINNSANLPMFIRLFTFIFIPFLILTLVLLLQITQINISYSSEEQDFFGDKPFLTLILFIMMFYYIINTLFNCILNTKLLRNGIRIEGTVKITSVPQANNLTFFVSWINPFTGATCEASSIIINSRKDTFDYRYIIRDDETIPICISEKSPNKYVLDCR